MTSIKVKFRASIIDDKEGTIYYQIIHRKVVRQIKTNYKIYSEEWDDYSSEIILITKESNRSKYLYSVHSRIKHDCERLTQILKSLERRGCTYTANDIVTIYNKQINGNSFFDYMQGLITRFIELKKFRTSETYQTTLNSFMRFRNGLDLSFDNISSDLMMDYEAYLKDQNLTMNSISFYMRILRATYNRAVESELTEQKSPFKKVYTGVDKTVKRALPLKHIKKIKALDLTLRPDLMFARDLFLMSFYTRGMSFVDMAFLRKKDLQNSVISYRRRKTGQQLLIKCEPCLKEILNKYPNHNTEYLLPIIKDQNRSARDQYRSMLSTTNAKLRKVGEIAGITTPLTLYVARHSWASVAKNRNIPISVISEGMGHDSEATTQIYLASLDTSIVDRANRLILKC